MAQVVDLEQLPCFAPHVADVADVLPLPGVVAYNVLQELWINGDGDVLFFGAEGAVELWHVLFEHVLNEAFAEAGRVAFAQLALGLLSEVRWGGMEG